MLDLLTEVVGSAPSRCTYAEARHVATDEEDLLVRNGRVDHVDSTSADGVGVRVRAGGGWGFAATRDTTRAGIERALARALAIAESQPSAPAGPLAPVAPARGHWACAHDIDPFAVSLEDKLALLFAAEAAAARRRRRAATRGSPARRPHARAAACAPRSPPRKARPAPRSASSAARRSASSRSTATSCRCARIPARTAAPPPARAGSTCSPSTSPPTPRASPPRSLELLVAPECPAGRRTVILGGEQLALQIHESIGHALELDRMQLMEASYAGASWVVPGDLGRLRYGSEHLDITADATLPGGLGTFGWDDEGVAADADAARRGGTAARGVVGSRLGGGDRPASAPAAARVPTASPASRSCA